MGVKRSLVVAGQRLGLWRASGRLFGKDRLTVLAYHRVIDHRAPEFVGYQGVVSASPDEFGDQIAWARDHFTPVTLDEVVAASIGGPLPERPLLVTFDDGYADNLHHALPILDRHGVRPTVFLATDHIGLANPFWWDLASWAFTTTAVREAALPLLGTTRWSSDHRDLQRRWMEAAKRLPEPEKLAALDDLITVLEVTPGGGEPDPSTLSWSDVEQMSRRGVDFGAHTVTHPILTKVSPEVAGDEIRRSISTVREATGRPVLGFAYPNGRTGDFDDVAKRAVAAAGVPLAFSLVPGPTRISEVRADPLSIRRVYVHHGDGVDRFAAKVGGVPRLASVLR